MSKVTEECTQSVGGPSQVRMKLGGVRPLQLRRDVLDDSRQRTYVGRVLRRATGAAVGALVFSLSGFAYAKDYKSAEYITRNKYGFGAFEAKIRAPEGPGVIGTFFLWRPGSELPSVPWEEIDFEFGPAGGDYQTQVMTPGGANQEGRTEHKVYFSLPTEVYDTFYTYRMEWTPDYIAFYVNGTRVRYETDKTEYAALFNVDSNGDTPTGERMEVRLGLWPALSNIFNWAGTFDGSTVPTAQYVDYIKIWDYTPGASNPFGQLLYSDEFDSLRSDRWYAANWTFEFSASDYVSSNIGTRDGLLILSLTDNANQGFLPDLPPEGGGPTQITDGAIIEAEDYDFFLENSAVRNGHSECSSTSVDAQRTSDPIGGRCNVGWTEAGEWLEYYVDVTLPGYYDVNFRVSSGSAAMSMHLEVDGVDVSGPIPAPGLGWHNWTYITAPSVFLSGGSHVIRTVFDTGDINFNFIAFDYLGADSTSAPDTGETSGGGDETSTGDTSVSTDPLPTSEPGTTSAPPDSTSGEDSATSTDETSTSSAVTTTSADETSTSADDTSEPDSEPEPDPVAAASLHITTDWGSGYCADLTVSSTTGVGRWEVDVSTPGASIYTSWNLTLAGTPARYTIGPVAWNSIVLSGSSRVVGFCANRQSMSALPTVLAVRAW